MMINLNFDELSREEIIKEFKNLEENHKHLYMDFQKLLDDLKNKDDQILFLREVILNLTAVEKRK